MELFTVENHIHGSPGLPFMGEKKIGIPGGKVHLTQGTSVFACDILPTKKFTGFLLCHMVVFPKLALYSCVHGLVMKRFPRISCHSGK